MAWCPKCDGNYQVVVSVKGSSKVVPVTSERYNREGDYTGYETSEMFDVRVESLPRCSNCYSVLELPNVTSREEYFYKKRELRIQTFRSRKPSKPPVPFGMNIFGWGKRRYIEDSEKYNDRITRWEIELSELQSMEYSDENYERLRPKTNHISVQSQTQRFWREKRPMERFHQWKKKK